MGSTGISSVQAIKKVMDFLVHNSKWL